MNFVGKLLVIFIMLFSVVFAGLASVVFQTSVNYKEELAKTSSKLAEATRKSQEANDLAKASANDLAKAKEQATAEAASLKSNVDVLSARNNDLEAEKKDAATQVTVAQQSLGQSQAETAARVRESDVLRDNLKKVEEESNQLKIVQTEKNATIRELQIKLATAVGQNRTLLADNTAYAGYLRSKGFSDDVAQIKGVSVPPKVKGQILQVNAANTGVVISIGSDDGLVPGHVLDVYRTAGGGEYLCKIRIVSTDPNRASALVVNKTYLGKKLQEGDIVSSTTTRGS